MPAKEKPVPTQNQVAPADAIGLPAMAANATATYNAAADHFDAAPLAFWDRHGRRAVARLNLPPGARVLDVGCGTGASALPAAAAVGPAGSVVGIDVAENMLRRGRAKATALSLANVTFTRADMSATGYGDASFDAVISVFSIFFMPDMPGQVAELWRLVRPGGQLAVTVWGAGAFHPAAAVFQEEVRRVRPDIPTPRRPWEHLTDLANLRKLLRGGTTDPVIEIADDVQPLAGPDAFWTVALGSGFRGEIEQLTPPQQQTVRAETARRLALDAVDAMQTNAIHASATKPLRAIH